MSEEDEDWCCPEANDTMTTVLKEFKDVEMTMEEENMRDILADLSSSTGSAFSVLSSRGKTGWTTGGRERESAASKMWWTVKY